MIRFQSSSGNSSAVEHDLAKVGVASSNLVSRSILLFFLFFIHVGAVDKFYIKKSYCVDNMQDITSSLFTKNQKNSFFILTLPKNRAKYSISSLKIVSAFKKNDINITDISGGVVVFRNCKLPIDIKKIKQMIEERFKERYKNIKIDKIDISSPSSLMPSLSSYHIQRIELKDRAFRKRSGTFGLVLKKGDEQKKIYLKYNIDATIVVFKANYNLRNGKILKKVDYRQTRVKFQNLPPNILILKPLKNYIIKGYIRKDAILDKNHFKIKKDLLKGDYIKAILSDENMILEIDAHLLTDANIGDKIKIRTVSGKVFDAKIVSKRRAKILE